MAENFPNLVKETDIQVQEAQKVSNEMNPKRPTSRYVIITMSKVKERDFPCGPVVKNLPLMQGMWIRSLARELGSHMLRGK